jgi:hypothetical protein
MDIDFYKYRREIFEKGVKVFMGREAPVYGIDKSIVSVKNIEPIDLISKEISDLFNTGDEVNYLGETDLKQYVFLPEDERCIYFDIMSLENAVKIPGMLWVDNILKQENLKPNPVFLIPDTADVKTSKDYFEIKPPDFKAKIIHLGNWDGDTIIDNIKWKFPKGEELTLENILDIVFYPFMGSSFSTQERVMDSIITAIEIPNWNQQLSALCLIYTLLRSYLKKDHLGAYVQFLSFTKLAHFIRELEENE